MNLFPFVYLRRNEIIRPVLRSRLKHLMKIGNIYASDQISTNKKNWVRFDQSPEFAEYFKRSPSAGMESQVQAADFPVEKEFQGALVCPQCEQDYPDLADYQSLIDEDRMVPLRNIISSLRPKRFKPFPCVQCGTLLKKTLGPLAPYLRAGVVFFSFTIFAYIFNLVLDHEPLGFGFDMYYENQYLDNPTMFFVMMMASVTYFVPTAAMEKYLQRLEYGEYNKNPGRVHHQYAAVIMGVIVFVFFSLGLYLNICKDLITFQVKPTFHHNTKSILKWTPLWKNPYYTVQGQGHLLNGEFTEAVENFDHAIELKKDHSYPYFYRGIAHYYLDQYDLAESDLNRAIEIDTGKWEPDDLYKKLWIFLAREKENQSGQAYIKSIRSELTMSHWPDSLFLLFTGEIKADRLKSIPRKREWTKKCQAYFYAGIFYKIKKRYEEARTAFESAQETKAEDCIEIHAAEFELADLDNSN